MSFICDYAHFPAHQPLLHDFRLLIGNMVGRESPDVMDFKREELLLCPI